MRGVGEARGRPRRCCVQEAPFFTDKLQVKVLPCVIVFLNGVATERLIGFDVFGDRDDFTSEQMSSWLVRSGAVTIRCPPPPSLSLPHSSIQFYICRL